MKGQTKCLVIALISLIAMIAMYFGSENANYMQYHHQTVEVTEKYQGGSYGKRSRMEFIAVFKTEDGRYFDRNVGASAYSQYQIGGKYTMELREFDIQQNGWDNLIWLFGAVVVYVVGSVVFISCMVFGLNKKAYTWMFETDHNPWA